MAFAAAFLLPADRFVNDVYSQSLEALVSLKAKWKVSVGAMIKRLRHLDEITEHYERRLWQYYSYRKWRTREPLDDIIPIEQPQNLRSSIEMLIEDNSVTKRDLLKEIGLASSDVTSLTGLPPNFFDDDPPNLVRLRPAIRRLSDSDDSDGDDNVVPFNDKRK